MKSFLEETIQSLIPKPKITIERLNEYGEYEERPSNIQPETARDLIAYSIRDLKVTINELKSHLRDMQKEGANEVMILDMEQQIDILEATTERLHRAMKISPGANLDNPETRQQWAAQYGESVVTETAVDRLTILKQQIDNGEVPEVVVAGGVLGKNTTGDLEKIGYAEERNEPSRYGKDLMSSWYEYIGPGRVKIIDKNKTYILTASPKGPNEKNTTPPVEWWPT